VYHAGGTAATGRDGSEWGMGRFAAVDCRKILHIADDLKIQRYSGGFSILYHLISSKIL
jgi:hypothetical protein